MHWTSGPEEVSLWLESWLSDGHILEAWHLSLPLDEVHGKGAIVWSLPRTSPW